MWEEKGCGDPRLEGGDRGDRAGEGEAAARDSGIYTFLTQPRGMLTCPLVPRGAPPAVAATTRDETESVWWFLSSISSLFLFLPGIMAAPSW